MSKTYTTLVGVPPSILGTPDSNGLTWQAWYRKLLAGRYAYCNVPRATTYYISNSQGNDTTGDGTMSLPWKTIAKAQAIETASSGNIAFLFKAGDEWNETTGFASTKNFITVDAYGTGAKPFFNCFTVKYPRGSGWANASGNRYTISDSNDIAWVRDQAHRLDIPYTRVSSATLVEVTPLSFFYEAGKVQVLHINCGVGINPANLNLEAVISNSTSNGLSFSGDGWICKNMRADGWGCHRTTTATQIHPLVSLNSGTNEGVFVNCEGYYCASHVFTHYLGAGSGGIATFINCKAGYGKFNGGGETNFNSFSDSGGHESIFHNCECPYGTLPSDDWLSATATMTIASPAVVTANGHQLVAGDPIVFTTTGALPTGVTAGTTYYVIATGLAVNTFRFSATLGGAAVNTTGSQSGTHTLQWSNKVRGGTFYAHTTSGTVSLEIIYGMTSRANKWGIETPTSVMGNLPTVTTITDVRGFVVNEVYEENNVGLSGGGNGFALGATQVVQMNCAWYFKPREVSAAAMYATGVNGWAINCFVQVDLSTISASPSIYGIWNSNPSGGQAVKIYNCHLHIKNYSTGDFALDVLQYFNGTRDDAGEIRNSIISVTGFSGGHVAYFGFNNIAAQCFNNAYFGLTQDAGAARGYDLHANKVALASLPQPLQPAFFNSSLYHAGASSIGITYDAKNTPRQTTPSIGPVDELPYDVGINSHTLQYSPQFSDTNVYVPAASKNPIFPTSGALGQGVFVWPTLPGVIYADGKPLLSISTDGTVNWTISGLTTTLTVFPTADIYAYPSN